ncbi:MAG TPA: hypothetical protein VK718_00050 [Ferruginibacter sp.]|jgi:hypothetical protein|nr:hypothetical protein [Ferruginibacter sp.]
MKKVLIAMLFAAITFSASAQRHFGGGGFYHGGGGFYGPRVSFGIGYPYYAPFYYPYYYGGYPYYYGGGYRVPGKLELQIQDIKNDYKQRIWDAKHDMGIPRRERRRHVRQLKHDEDQAIINAQRDYYTNRQSQPATTTQPPATTN